MKIISNSVNETLRVGRKIAKYLQKGDIVCLFGQLGAGKTVLTKGIASGLGIDKDKIISPTFVLVKQQTTRHNLSFYHFDFYRINSPEDIFALGYEEYFYGNGISVIEWPARLSYLLPTEFLKVELSLISDSRREFRFSAFGRRYKDLLKKIKVNNVISICYLILFLPVY